MSELREDITDILINEFSADMPMMDGDAFEAVANQIIGIVREAMISRAPVGRVAVELMDFHGVGSIGTARKFALMHLDTALDAAGLTEPDAGGE